MQIFNHLDEWRAIRRSLPMTKTIGFVPTMGNLHAGHASLFTLSKQENDYSVASLFINPTQFNRPDDFQHYPRTLDADLALLEKARSHYYYLQQAMYEDSYRYQVRETELCLLMEGKHRPGHFNGVLTIVMKLLNLVKPQQAYFGEKDYQQYLLIRDMVNAFFMDVMIKACPTIRETSGLAYSSRNNRLNQIERQEAEKFARIFHQQKPRQSLLAELARNDIRVEYLEDYQNRRFAAVLIGDIRLIDNYSL